MRIAIIHPHVVAELIKKGHWQWSMSEDSLRDFKASTVRPEPPIEKILGPFQRFLHAQATSGILLLGVTVVALVWANSP